MSEYLADYFSFPEYDPGPTLTGGASWNNFSLPVTTVTDLMPPDLILSQVVPQNLVETPRSSGITLSGVLGGVEATAKSALDIFGKVYSLQNEAASQKYQQEIGKASLKVETAKALGSLELTKAQIDAQKQIGILQAQSAVKDQQAKTASSSAAGYVTSGIGSLLTPQVLLMIGGAILLFKKGGKK